MQIPIVNDNDEIIEFKEKADAPAKVITMCGSVRFINEIKFHAARLELVGNCVLSIVELPKKDNDYTPAEYDMLGNMHKQKIEMSDAIFVVNVDNYIGNSVRSEVEYAKSLGKEIVYLESPTE